MSNYPDNCETDTKLFKVLFDKCSWGEVWADGPVSALSKAQELYPDFPKKLFEVKFVRDLYPVNKVTITKIRNVLDAFRIPYQDPAGNEHQLILSGTADIIEGAYGNGDDSWDFFVRATPSKPSQLLTFKTIAEFGEHLAAAYVHQPFDEFSSEPLPTFNQEQITKIKHYLA